MQKSKLLRLFRKRMKDPRALLPELNLETEIDFSFTIFTTLINFNQFIFPFQTEFSGTHFQKDAVFDRCFFADYSHFQTGVFEKRALFRYVHFGEHSNFMQTSFQLFSSFENTKFVEDADFSDATFKLSANFDSVSFGSARYSNATFKDNAIFSHTTFRNKADFGAVIFLKQVNFMSAKFNSETIFSRAKYLNFVPEFFGADIFPKTSFPTVESDENWPGVNAEEPGIQGTFERIGLGKKMHALDQKNAYVRLREFAISQKRVDDEQFFHRMEMRCKRETEGWRYRWIYTVFEGLSDYGNSVLRPAGWLFVLWLAGAICKLEPVVPLVRFSCPDYHSIPQAMGWSLANLFPFFRFRQLYFNEALVPSLKFIGGGQTIFGFILLFFLGLGLRNRFRLR